MSNLPEPLIAFLNSSAESAGVEYPSSNSDLFKEGVLDSFTLVDFVSVIEAQLGIQIPDSDVNPGNFQKMDAIEHYISSHLGGK